MTTDRYPASRHRPAIARTPCELPSRWGIDAIQHTPPPGEYEDGFQVNHIHAARLELVRIYYLLGETKRGDELLLKVVSEG